MASLCGSDQALWSLTVMGTQKAPVMRTGKALFPHFLWNGPPLPQRRLACSWRGRRQGMHIAVLGIDLGKNSCSVVGQDATGRIVLRRRMRRDGVITLVASLSPCVVAMEACCGAHHMGRLFHNMGHTVRLMSPEYV